MLKTLCNKYNGNEKIKLSLWRGIILVYKLITATDKAWDVIVKNLVYSVKYNKEHLLTLWCSLKSEAT